MCNAIIQHLYALQNDHPICHHIKYKFFSLWWKHLLFKATFKFANTILLITVPMLHTTSPWLTYFIIGNVYLSLLFTHFTHPPTCLPHGNHQALLWDLSFLLLCFRFFFSPFIFISWRLITLQYCSGFCHTLTWISHGFTCSFCFLYVIYK